VGATGRATEVRFAGTFFQSRPIGRCIEQAARDVAIERFGDEQWTTDYSFMVP
jgi:hypothetical protein